MDTFELLQAYLKSNVCLTDVTLYDHTINGSIIKLSYSYRPNYEWDKDYISFDNTLEVGLLDYITWVYNFVTNK